MPAFDPRKGAQPPSGEPTAPDQGGEPVKKRPPASDRQEGASAAGGEAIAPTGQGTDDAVAHQEPPPDASLVRVKGVERPVYARPGTSIMKACNEANVSLFWGPWAQAFNCRGLGLCNLCHVEIIEGAANLAPPSKREEKRLQRKPEHIRIGCLAKVTGPVLIEPFPLRRLDTFAEEALERAELAPEDRELVHKERLAELKDERLDAREVRPKKERKGLLARFGAKKGDDGGGGDGGDDGDAGDVSAVDRADATAGQGSQKKRRGLRRGKKKDKDADADAEGQEAAAGPGDGADDQADESASKSKKKPKGRFAVGRKGGKGEASAEAPTEA